jgi:competence protein ComEC
MDPLVTIGVALGLGGVLPFAPAEVGVLAAALGALAWRREPGRGRLLVVAGIALVMGGARAALDVRDHAARMEAAAVVPRTARCTGVVRVEESPVLARGALRWAGTLRDAECEGVAWSGRVTLYGGPREIARGDDVAVVAQIAPPTRLWNDTDPRPGEARRGSLRSGGVVDARIVRRGSGVVAWIDRARARVRGRIEATFSEEMAPMARALVLGESDLSPEDDAAMRASGLSHLLAVSGMHLVIAVGVVVAGLRALLRRWTWLAQGRDVGRLAAMVGVPLAWAYAEFAGDGGSTRRAAWMLTVSFVVRAIGRRPSAARAFGWSLVAMTVRDPLAAYDVSFVLSGAATAGLFTLSAPIARAGRRWPAVLQPVVKSAAATVAATIPCAPILARFAPTLPLGGVVANLLAVPVGESAALPVCLVHALLAPWPAAERGAALVASGALGIVRGIARGFAGMHVLSANVPAPTSWQTVAIAIALGALVITRKDRRAPVCLGAVAVTLLLEIGARRAGRPTGVLRATFLDVGQGDAALVDLPDGEAMVIDGGGLVGSPIDTGERVVAPVLRGRRRDEVALAVLTHPHPDHFTGLVSGLAAVRVGALWDTGQGEREGVGGGYAALLAQARARGVAVARPPEICGEREIGGARLEVLAPCPEATVERTPNDNSIVLRLSYGTRAFLFVGDAERAEEAELLKSPARLRADVLKVGHHGSRTSSSPALLAAVRPSVAVISVGARNRFGHPSAVTLGALEGIGARVFRTDRTGAVTVTTDGTSLEVTTAAP